MKIKTRLWCSRCVLTAFALLILAGVTCSVTTHDTSAASSEADCLAESGAPSVGSVQKACGNCFNPNMSNSTRGTLWFTHDDGSSTNKNSDVVRATAAEVASGTINIRMFGQVYSCGQAGSGSNVAAHIWFGEAGKDNSSDTHLTFIQMDGDSLNRGTGTGNTYTWYTPLGQSRQATIDIEGFRNEGAGATCTTSGNVETCRRTVSVNRCFGVQSGGYRKPGNSACYGDDSEIVIEIPRVSTSGQFWSTSTVHAPSQPNMNVNQPNPSQSGVDAVADGMSITTTENSVNLEFWHTLYHDESLVNEPTEEHRRYPAYPITKEDLCAEWSIVTDIDGSQVGGIQPAQGKFCQQDYPGQGSSGVKVSSGTVNVQVAEGQSKKVCSTIRYRPKYLNIQPVMSPEYWQVVGYQVYKDGRPWDGWGPWRESKACANVYHTDVTQETSFWSSSEVIIDSQNGDVDSHNLVSQLSKDQNGSTAKISLSTDYDNLGVKFRHRIYYDDLLWDWSLYPGSSGHPVSSADYFPDVATNWIVTVTIEYEDGTETDTKTGSFHTNASGAASGTVAYEDTSPISIDLTRQTPGNPVTITSKIEFEPASVTLSKVGHTDHPGCCGRYGCTCIIHDYYTYGVTSSGGKGSTAAANEVRNPIVSHGSGMSNGASIMHAGESQGTVGWNTEGTSQPVRRLSAFQGASYVVSDLQPYIADLARGNIGALADIRDDRYHNAGRNPVCDYFGSSHTIVGGVPKARLDIVDCSTFQANSGAIEGTLNYGANNGTHTTNVNTNVVTPDEVGYKYCNSYAYQYQYWVNYKVDSIRDDWNHEGSKDYWEVYDSTCRTVVKKPTSALWNGSLMTNGGIRTAPATRYNNASSLYNVPAGSQARQLYGSWSEYLAVVGGSAGNYASGTILGAGTYNPLSTGFDTSRLTIANTGGSPGYSGITNNPTYRLRLRTYFEDICGAAGVGATLPQGTCRDRSWLDSTTVTNGTNIVTINGSYTLDHSIIMAPAGPYSNLYALPRNIIFIDGDLNITGNVNQIDAWLVVSGKINTCSDFNPGTTSDTPGLNGSACTRQLVFNGPVRAAKLDLRRSYGAGADWRWRGGSQSGDGGRATAGEIFNFRADDYLWAYAQAGRYPSSYVESYSRELAPRY